MLLQTAKRHVKYVTSHYPNPHQTMPMTPVKIFCASNKAFPFNS